MKLNRREFVASTSATVAGSGVLSGRQAAGPNDILRGAVIGTGGMGRANLRDFLRVEGVHIAAVCDVWEKNRELAAEMTAGQPGGKAHTFTDYRRVLDLKDVDFVVVATPDHWHALPTIHACDAGKDVYVEKPLSHSILEGRKMVEAARRNERIVQMGTQQRSGRHYQEAVGLIRSGALGRISHVRAWNFENESPAGMGNPPDCDPPQGLDWDMWLGPAPKVPFNPNRFIGTFRWFWDYSGGKLTDWGTHHIDIVQWAMNVDGPKSVAALGSRYVLKDNRETPDTLETVFEYPGFMLTFSNRVANARDPVRRDYGIEFFGSDATLFIDRDGFEVYPETQGEFDEPRWSYLPGNPEPSGDERPRVRKGRAPYQVGEGSEQHLNHVRNFVACVKSRELPISDVEIGHRSTTAPHLANISLKVGRRIYWDSAAERIVDDSEASALMSRPYRAPWTL